MSQKNLSLKKKQHFLHLIEGIPRQKILFCPVDVSKHFHISFFHDFDGNPVVDFFAFSSSQVGFTDFITRLQLALQARAPQLVIIGMEPTNVYYEGLLYNLHLKFANSTSPRVELALVDPAAVNHNRQQNSLRFQKSDFIDTASIGDLLTRGLFHQAHLASPLSIHIKELSRSLNYYRRQQLRLWNQLLTTLDRVFPNLLLDYGLEQPLCKQPNKSKLLDDLLHLCPNPYQLVEFDTDQLIDLFHQHQRQLGPQRALKILEAAQRALLLPQPYQQIHQQTLENQLRTFDFFSQQIAQLDTQLQSLITQTPARHLIGIKGNSQQLTAAFVASLEDWDRYTCVQQIWAAAGLNPTIKQSGGQSSKPRISKDGSLRLRNAIYKMTSSVIWHEPTFGIVCFQRLLQGAQFVPTILHVGRKLTNTALALLKSDRPFQPRFDDYQEAEKKLRQLKEQYLKEKKQTKRS
jgi:transposase